MSARSTLMSLAVLALWAVLGWYGTLAAWNGPPTTSAWKAQPGASSAPWRDPGTRPYAARKAQ